MTILGYSLPAGDRITAELLRGAAPVDIVNLDVGSVDNLTSPLCRARALGMRISKAFDGPRAIVNYTTERLAAMSAAEPRGLSDSGSLLDTVVATVHLREFDSGTKTFVVVSNDGRFVGWEVSRYSASSSEMSPREFAYNAHGRERFSLDAILTRATVPMGGTVEIARRDYVVIGWRNAMMGRWPVIELDLAPASGVG